MSTYAVGILREVEINAEIIKYVEGMDETLKPFGGKFIIHGGPPTVLEGEWTNDFIVIEFPSFDRATQWYQSDAYQRILPYRQRNSKGVIFLIEGVKFGHRATDILKT